MKWNRRRSSEPAEHASAPALGLLIFRLNGGHLRISLSLSLSLCTTCALLATSSARADDIVLSPASAAMQNGGAQTCQLAFSTTNVTVTQCRGPFTTQPFATPVALTDYGSGTPSSQRTATSWLMSLSRRSPDVSGGNSHLRVYGNDRTFPDTAIAVQDEYDLDFLGCSSFGLGDDAQSYFGGTSVDYCEFCDRIVRVGMGDLLTDPVGDKCF